jgi:hypothetical protein
MSISFGRLMKLLAGRWFAEYAEVKQAVTWLQARVFAFYWAGIAVLGATVGQTLSVRGGGGLVRM